MQGEQILYIGGFELPDKNAAAQRVIANGKIFADLGYSVCYLSSDRTLTERYPIKQHKDTFERFIFYRTKYPNKLSEWFIYLFSIRNIVQLMDELPNLTFIIAYNYPAPALARLNRKCKLKGICLIADCTEWYVPVGNFIYKTIKRFDTYLRMQVIHPRLDGIIAISKYLYEFYNVNTANVLQVPPLVDLKSEKWENSYVDSGEELILVYAGSPGKGAKDRIDVIIKALSIIKATTNIKFSLHIIGLSRQQYIVDFGQEFLTDDMEAAVIFKGRLSHTETLNEVKRAHYAIFIRDNNLVNTAGFPTKFVEALSCGTPVLSNDYSNILDYLRDGYNGYRLDTSSEEALLKTLVFALTQSKEKVAEMKANIKKDKIFDYRGYLASFQNFLDVAKK